MLIGFKAGIGLVIVLDQVPKLLGVHLDKDGFFAPAGYRSCAARVLLPTVAVGAVMIVMLLAIKRFSRRCRRRWLRWRAASPAWACSASTLQA